MSRWNCVQANWKFRYSDGATARDLPHRIYNIIMHKSVIFFLCVPLHLYCSVERNFVIAPNSTTMHAQRWRWALNQLRKKNLNFNFGKINVEHNTSTPLVRPNQMHATNCDDDGFNVEFWESHYHSSQMPATVLTTEKQYICWRISQLSTRYNGFVILGKKCS